MKKGKLNKHKKNNKKRYFNTNKKQILKKTN